VVLTMCCLLDQWELLTMYFFQASISSNEIKFVRIDGSTFPKERQNAVESFRSSSEVKTL
jgi:SNF2 family DNA or RNA helicase